MNLASTVRGSDKDGVARRSIQGSIVAIVTPMRDDGALDLPAFCALLDWHVAEGTDAVVVVGTSGESPTLPVDEHLLMIDAAVKHLDRRIPVIAGAGGNSTNEAIALTREAQRLGADATLQVVPYYNKPTQEGIYRHFKAIAEAVDLPSILYNVPGRTVADMSNETTIRLAAVPGIIGIKDATGNLDRAAGLLRDAPEGFSVFSGDDLTAVALMWLGGHGNISVTANVAPRAMHDLCKAAMAGDIATSRALHLKLLALHRALFVEANPIPVKWALQQLNKIAGGVRLPLTPFDARFHADMRTAMRDAGLLSSI
ncbi:dihydrodipicolinate synthase [Robbsia andropogonis]|uniref:4-hydroxy-tetrahydrodipicolinate synthase n=1 Tax=Robbsia andropogonis TaxID=28092 RepID=A0A0F5JXV9_9BURK|nr:4-hydroxy-tetrahydrodipicolinate synthase [Robbsia andropogonis]KKB62484.1 dihydrodipicolinate synthase [Robbsia andropogonis]